MTGTAALLGWQLGPSGAVGITDTMVLPPTATLPFDGDAPARVAPQVVFLLREDLAGPGVTAAAVCAASSVAAGLAVTTADGTTVTGLRLAAHALPCDFDLSLVGALLELSGDVVATAAGAAIAGHPAEAVAASANDRTAAGQGPLRRGQFVASGLLLDPRPVTAPGEAAAVFGRLGTVAVTIA